MSQLDFHKELNTHVTKIEEIEKKLKAAKVEYLYYQAVTLSGRVIGKVVPARHVLRNLEKGVLFHRTALADMQTTRQGHLLGGGPAATEIVAMPDMETFTVLPWDNQVGSFFCRIYEPDYALDNPGTILPNDARSHLIQTHQAFTQKTGLVLKSGCEPEMSWLGEGLDITVRPDTCTSYNLGHLELMRPIYKKVIQYATAMGLDMIEGDYEDPGQLELNWMFDSCELTADRLIIYRLVCRQVAKELGIQASFMPKPSTGAMGNGCHHNISLWHNDKNVTVDEEYRYLKLSQTGGYALGGLLKHLAGSMLIMGSTVNSYKRFWDMGQFAPNIINWGIDNKTCSIRLANGRFEYKVPDASVNPYLSHALLLAAIMDGLNNRLDPGKPETQDSTHTNDTLFGCIPLSLGDAIPVFKEDKIICESLPKEMVETYLRLKTDEWERYCSAVTDWERKMYLDYLP